MEHKTQYSRGGLGWEGRETGESTTGKQKWEQPGLLAHPQLRFPYLDVSVARCRIYDSGNLVSHSYLFYPPPFFLSLSLLFLQCHCPTFFCSSHESHVCTFTFGNFFLFLISPFALFRTRLGDGVYLWNFFWNRGPKLWNLQLQIANPCKALAINCNRITDCVRPISFASTRRYLTFQDSKSFFF